MDLRLADQVPDGRRGDEHLGGDHPSEPVPGLDELLGHHALQGCAELDPNLLLLVRRKCVDDPVDGLRRILRVQCGEDQVPGLGGGDGGLDRLQVAHLTYQDDVRVLPKDVLEGARKGEGVRADLALVHDAPLVPVQIFDGVLHRHDVDLPFAVHHVDELGSLIWHDLCGPPGSIYRICDLAGNVTSAGDHDNGESFGGAPGTRPGPRFSTRGSSTRTGSRSARSDTG